MGLLSLPSLADPHVHLREPGSENKEDFYTGTCAALAGGYTALLDMPNNPRPTITLEALEEKRKLASARIVCDLGFNFGAFPGNEGEYSKVVSRVAGLKLYLGETHGPLVFGGLAQMMAVFAAWPPGPEFSQKPLLIHAEGPIVAAVIGLAALYDRKIHICHLSKKTELILIKAAKARGLKVTCEVAPHHLFLTGEDAGPGQLGSFAKMSPALQSGEDLDALWKGLADGSVDMVATDHAPHTRQEKETENPPFGVPGLETAFSLLFRAAHQGRAGLTLERLVNAMARAPRRIFGLPANQGEIEIDPDDEFTFKEENLLTKCGWTPFRGFKGRGRIRRVHLRGNLVYEDGKVLCPAGSGKIIFQE